MSGKFKTPARPFKKNTTKQQLNISYSLVKRIIELYPINNPFFTQSGLANHLASQTHYQNRTMISQYISSCITLGILNENGQLSEFGRELHSLLDRADDYDLAFNEHLLTFPNIGIIIATALSPYIRNQDQLLHHLLHNFNFESEYLLSLLEFCYHSKLLHPDLRPGKTLSWIQTFILECMGSDQHIVENILEKVSKLSEHQIEPDTIAVNLALLSCKRFIKIDKIIPLDLLCIVLQILQVEEKQLPLIISMSLFEQYVARFKYSHPDKTYFDKIYNQKDNFFSYFTITELKNKIQIQTHTPDDYAVKFIVLKEFWKANAKIWVLA